MGRLIWGGGAAAQRRSLQSYQGYTFVVLLLRKRRPLKWVTAADTMKLSEKGVNVEPETIMGLCLFNLADFFQV